MRNSHLPVEPTLPEPMASALALATQNRLATPPNPSVGCVLTTAQGLVLGQGCTQRTGGPHAEIVALHDAAQRGNSVAGATAWVTLEPCSHHGRTGPCCDVLIAAGIGKVVAATADPNPLVSGQGFARLRAAGIEVETGPGASAARELNIGFFSRMLRKRPWVRMKIAASLDGKTALENGASQWITTDLARADGHAWRARASAVLTGIGTVLEDDPGLDVRLVDTPRQPALVVVDSHLRTPPDARLFTQGRDITLYAAVHDGSRQAALAQRGAKVIYLPGQADAAHRVDLHAMLADMAQREINELHVEAGYRLNGALIGAGLVDELLLYLAPKLLGQGRGMAHFGPLATLDQAALLEFTSSAMLGADLRLTARFAGHDRF